MDRPKIAYYVLNIESHVNKEMLWLSCIKLVKCLNQLLEPEECILVFLPSRACVERFSEATKCAMYHSQLPKVDNTKAYNLHCWDTGNSKVMAATTAAGQGIN
jgi:superfamily II DNA helicase RecQ